MGIAWEVRVSIRRGARRVLVAGLETGAAAGLAWWVAATVLSSEQPIYSTVAAVVVTGAGLDRRIAKVASMLKGMGIAIVLSEVAVRLIGGGAIQIGVVTAAAIILTSVITDDVLSVVYAGLNAGILVGLGGEGWIPDRLLEALIGAGVAYALIYLVLPPRPDAHLRDALDHQVDIARKNLARVAESLRSRGPLEATEAAKETERVERQLGALVETFDFSEEVARFSPWRRRQRDLVSTVRRRARSLQSVLRDTVSLIRTAARAAQQSDLNCSHLAEALDEHAAAFDQVKAVLVAGEIPQERADAINRHTARTRQLVIDPGSEEPLTQAVVEEVLNLSDVIDQWVDHAVSDPDSTTATVASAS